MDTTATAPARFLVAQGGGPTAVINQSLVGVVLEARRHARVTHVYGARHGVRGVYREDLLDLSGETSANLEAVAATPAAAPHRHLPQRARRVAFRHHGGRAIARANASAAAGASGFFVPGLVDEKLLERVCKECPLPVNVMMFAAAPSAARCAELGVARISHGPGPYRVMAKWLEAAAREVYPAGSST